MRNTGVVYHIESKDTALTTATLRRTCGTSRSLFEFRDDEFLCFSISYFLTFALQN